MNVKTVSLIKSAVAVALLGAASVTAVADSYDMKGKDVLSVAKQQGKFTTLAKAIEAAGLQETLTAQGPITILAPTDEAFAKLPADQLEALLKPENKEKLVQILTNHVVPGKALTTEQMKRQRGAQTLEGDTVRFELVRGRLRVNDARVTGDVKAHNGSIVAIDQVLLPN